MGNRRKTLNLEKIRISKLDNLNLIHGGGAAGQDGSTSITET